MKFIDNHDLLLVKMRIGMQKLEKVQSIGIQLEVNLKHWNVNDLVKVYVVIFLSVKIYQ